MEIVKEFNKENLGKIRVSLNKALEQVKSEYGIDIKIGNIGYSTNEFSTKLSVSTIDKSYKKLIGSDIQIGNTFISKNDNYKVIDIVPKNRKYPIIIQNLRTNTQYKVSETYFNNILLTK